MNELGNRFATDAAALGSGLARSASAMQVAGNDINQTLALITGGTEITQDADSLSNSLKVISMRLRGMKGELEELGEEYENVQSISKIQTQILNLTKGQVNIFKDDGTFKSTYDILEQISKVYDDLSDTSKASLTEILFGKLRANQGVALISAFKSGQVQKAYQTALDSSGSAMKEQERYMDSIQAKTMQLDASWQNLSQHMLSSEFLKGGIDVLRSFVDLLDLLVQNLGAVGAILPGFAGYKIFDILSKNGGSGIGGIINEFKALLADDGSATIERIVETFNNGTQSAEQFAATVEKVYPGMGSYFETLGEGQASVEGLTNAYVANGHAVEELSAKTKALAMAKNVLTSLGVSALVGVTMWGIQKLSKAISDYTHRYEILHDNAQKAMSEMTDVTDVDEGIDDSIQQFKQLRDELENGAHTAEDYAKVKAQLLELQNHLEDSFGKEVEGISLVNGAYKDQLELLNNLSAEKKNQWLEDNRGNITTMEKNDFVLSGDLANQLNNVTSDLIRDQNAEKFGGKVTQLLRENGVNLDKLKGNNIETYQELIKVRKVLAQNKTEIRSLDEETQRLYNHILESSQAVVDGYAQTYKEYLSQQEEIANYNKNFALYSEEVLVKGAQERFAETLDLVDLLNSATENYDIDKATEVYEDILLNEEYFDSIKEKLPDRFLQALADAFENIDQNKLNRTKLFNSQFTESIIQNLANALQGADVSDVLSGDVSGYGEVANNQFGIFKKYIESLGFTMDEFIPRLRELGIVTGYTATEISELFGVVNESVNRQLSELSTITETVSSSGSLTVEQYQKIVGMSNEYASALRVEADRVAFDGKQIRAIARERAADEKATLKEAQAQTKLQYVKEHNKLRLMLKDYQGLTAEKVRANQETLNHVLGLSREITQYDLLIAQLDEATNALTNYTAAKSEAAYGAQYDTASDAYKSIMEGFDSSKVGTKVFEAAVDALIPEDVINQGIEAIHDYYLNTLGKYFIYDDSGNILREGLEHFVQDGIDSNLFSGTLEDWAVNAGVKMQDVADQLGLTKEAVMSFFGALEEYGYGVNFTYFDELIETAGDDIVALQQLEDQLLAAGDYDGYLKVIERERQAASTMADNLLNQNQIMEDIATANANLQSMIDSGATTDEISAQITHIQELKDKLVEPSEINISIAKNEIETEIAELQSQLQEAMIGDSVADIRSASEIRAQIEELKGKNEKLIELEASVDTTEAEKKIGEIKSSASELTRLLSTNNTVKLSTSDAESKIKNLINLYNDYKRVVASTPTVRSSTPGSESMAPDAFANGTPGAEYSGTALVGEVGAEMLVRGNQWHLVGTHGAEFTNVHKGDIIFDANQTRHLMRNGRIGSRGSAFMYGTTGRAFVQGGNNGFRAWGSSSDDAADTISNAVDNATDAIEDATEANTEYIDEIEKLISSIDKQIERLGSISELYETYRNQNKVIDQNMMLQLNKLSTQSLAYDRYMRQAGASGLSQEWIDKVTKGNLDIEQISDETLQQQISDFTEWYEKAEACKDSIIDITKSLHDLSLQKLDNISNDFELVQGNLEALISRQQAVIDLNERIGKSATENDYKEIIEEQRDVTNYLAGELEQLEKELEQQINSGAIVKYDDCWWEWNTNIEKIRQNLAESEISVRDLVNSVRAIRWKGFEDALTTLSDMEEEIDDITNLIGDAPLFNDNGRLTNAGDTMLGLYAQQLAIAKKRTAEYDNAIKALDRDLRNGNISQQQYDELLKEYSKAQKKAIADTKAAEDAIIKLKFEGIDKATEAYQK